MSTVRNLGNCHAQLNSNCNEKLNSNCDEKPNSNFNEKPNSILLTFSIEKNMKALSDAAN